MKFNLKYLYLPSMIVALAFFAGCDDDDPTPVADVVEDTVTDMVEDTVTDVVEDMVPDTEEDVFVDTGIDMFEDADAAPPVIVSCTFNIDTATTADGTNALAFVPDGYSVYIAGNAFGNWGEFNDPQWDPRIPENIMTDNADGTYSITYDLEAGSALAFKFLISNELAGTGNGWGNGMKDWAAVTGGMTCGKNNNADCACLNWTGDTDWMTAVGLTTFDTITGGLWEVFDITAIVPDDDSTTHTFDTYMIEAWRDFASYTYDYYHSCD